MGHSTFLAASYFAGTGSAIPRVDVSQLCTRKGGQRRPSLSVPGSGVVLGVSSFVVHKVPVSRI